MRNAAHFRHAREGARLVGSEAGAAANSAAVVYWNIGLVLAAFLGLALTATAVLTVLGIR